MPSFADANNDGLGDLAGVRERLDYLAWLGVGAVWLTPFYPSPMDDGGYDVADFTAVDPRFGTLAEFRSLAAEAHQRHLRLIVDLVPNHTSDQHVWFRQARSGTDSPLRDYYIWQDPAPGGGAPNNWRSHFGGSAWSLDASSGQYWLHLFSPTQPDLNWRNPAVVQEFDQILRFWLEQGADDFRIDVAHGLVKDRDLRDDPPGAGGNLVRVHELDQPEVVELYRRWRALAEPHGATLLGEVALNDAARVSRYVKSDDGLHLAFWFGLIEAGWSHEALVAGIVDAEQRSYGRFAWFQGSHDRPRPATRLGSARRALVVATLLAHLPGLPVVYQGDELGLDDVKVPAASIRDAKAIQSGDNALSRDGSRTPMPWRPGPGLGFTSAAHSWLPTSGRTDADTVSVQRNDAASPLRAHRRLIATRAELAEHYGDGPLEWLHVARPWIAYRRGTLIVAVNCGGAASSAALPPGRWRVAFATERGAGGAFVEGELELPAESGVVLTRVQA